MSFSSFSYNASPYGEDHGTVNEVFCNNKQHGGASRVDIEQILVKFFKENPNPSDKEIHNLAYKLGINKHKFEEFIYALLSKLLKSC